MWEIQVASIMTIPVMIFVLEPYYLVFKETILEPLEPLEPYYLVLKEAILYRLVFADFSVFFTL